MGPRKVFTDDDEALMESLFETGSLNLSATASDLRKLPCYINFSQDFSNTTLKRYMDIYSKKVATKMGSKGKYEQYFGIN